MGFLDAPLKKLSVERVMHDGKTAWRYECTMKCDRHKKGACSGFIVLVQDEPPKTKEFLQECFYNKSKIDLEW